MAHSTRLDRLSALLQGLAPRVEVTHTGSADSTLAVKASSQPILYLHLLVQGRIRLTLPRRERVTVTAPAIIVCPASTAHKLTAPAAAGLASLVTVKAFLEGPVASLLLGQFAQPLVVSLDDAESSLHQVVRLIASELIAPRCGQSALLHRAGDILFIGLLRHLMAHPRASSGLFAGLADPRIARALVAIHTTPQDSWTLDKLAVEAGMSRTAFAVTFREVMTCPPGKYLSQLRLSIADRAVQSGLGLKRAARNAGYASPSALSRALSRARLDSTRSELPLWQ